MSEENRADGRNCYMTGIKAFAAHRIAHLPNTDLSEERRREVLASEVAGVASGKEADAEWRDWLLAKPNRLDNVDLKAHTALRAMQQYAAGLQGALKQIANGDVPRSVGKGWRADGQPGDPIADMLAVEMERRDIAF